MTFDMNRDSNDGAPDVAMELELLLREHNFPSASGFSAQSTTVSPQDLLLDHDLSAPYSTALTDFTSPSMYEDTPYDVSPAFDTINFGQPDWAPLFSNNDVYSAASFSTNEPPSLSSSTASLLSTAQEMVRTPSGSVSPPENKLDSLHRLSVAAGISKSSRRSLKDLPPIEVDEEDDRAIKRARNTLAARKSRQKKRDTEDMLRIALEAMTVERDRWKMVAIRHGAPIPDT